MPSPKEQCFQDALDAYNDNFPNQLPDLKMFQQWSRDIATGEWTQASAPQKFYHWIRDIFSARKTGSGPDQWRIPDITAPDGTVYDLKFTNSQGGVDPWGSKPGMGGQTQYEDQDEINKQANPNSGAMSLDKDSCECDKRGEPEPVNVAVPSPFFVPVPGAVPGAAPALGLGGAQAPAEVPAGGFGLPEFAFP